MEKKGCTREEREGTEWKEAETRRKQSRRGEPGSDPDPTPPQQEPVVFLEVTREWEGIGGEEGEGALFLAGDLLTVCQHPPRDP